jgi:glycosyltransferase involved in cell wall biosynthesis
MHSGKPVLKVLHIITGLNDGGAEGALYRLCLQNKDNRHTVVSLMDKGKYGPLLQAAGVSVHCLEMPQGKPTLVGMWRLWGLMRQHKPDAVQTWLYHADLLGGLVARLAGLRQIFWGIRHSNLTPGTVKRSTIVVAKLCARLSRQIPCRIVSCSAQAVKAHTAIGYDIGKFVVIPNGYDLSHYAPDQAARSRLRREWNMPHDTFVLGMVARFDLQKDHANLLAALGELKRSGCDFQCVLVGTGLERGNNQLMAWLQREDISDRVSLLGRRNDIPDVMNAIDLHVLSSLGEAFPNVLAEAMACGTPCVTTDVGDAALIVGEHGWVVPAQDAKTLAAALIRAKTVWETDPAVWDFRRAAARAHIAKHFSLEEMCARYDAVWTI